MWGQFFNVEGVTTVPLVVFFLNFRMGAGSMDYKELSQQIELSTSGLSAGTHVVQHHSDNYSYEQVCSDNMYNDHTDL